MSKYTERPPSPAFFEVGCGLWFYLNQEKMVRSMTLPGLAYKIRDPPVPLFGSIDGQGNLGTICWR